MIKSVLIASALLLVVAMASRPVVTREMVDHINAVQQDWVASTETSMSHITADQAQDLFGLKRVDMMKKTGLRFNFPRKTYSAAERAAVPDSFDSRENWPQCSTMKQVRDQSHCGACWAFGAVESMSDRECIFNKEDVALSAEIMNSCSGAGSCRGGQPYSAWKYWVSEGIPTEACRAFSLPGCDHHVPGSSNPCPTNDTYPTPKCVMQCVDGYPKTFKADLHYGASVYWVTGEEDMKAELYNNGPFEVAIDVYEDFLAYHSGVYHHISGKSDGGHAIKLIGYGEENGQKYWTLANSWNPHWGENGFFRMRRGSDECGVEDEGVAGKPKLF